MSKADELMKDYEQAEFSQRLNLYFTYRDMRGKFAECKHHPESAAKAPNPVQQVFEGLKAYLPDFTAFKRRRSPRTIIAG